jgi:hypothetical protein
MSTVMTLSVTMAFIQIQAPPIQLIDGGDTASEVGFQSLSYVLAFFRVRNE